MSPSDMNYFTASRTATYGFLASLPLLLLYEASILFVNHGSVGGIRVGADVWMKSVLVTIGAPGMLAVGFVVIAVGIAIYLRDRKKQIPLKPAFFTGLILESVLYSVLVAFAVSIVVSSLLAIIQDGATVRDLPLTTQLSLSLGAGLYEELVFRVLLVGGLAAALTVLTPRRALAYSVAAVVGALLFSAVHYVGAFGDPWQFGSFLFRFLFGLAMNAIFLLRGFGVAAWTHALYDVFVVTGLLG